MCQEEGNEICPFIFQYGFMNPIPQEALPATKEVLTFKCAVLYPPPPSKCQLTVYLSFMLTAQSFIELLTTDHADTCTLIHSLDVNVDQSVAENLSPRLICQTIAHQ